MESMQNQSCFSNSESTDCSLQQFEGDHIISSKQSVTSGSLSSSNWTTRNSQQKQNETTEVQHIICSPSIAQMDEDGPQWSPAAVNLLINFYKQHKSEFDDPTVKKRTIWNLITSHMREIGFQFEASVVERKWRNLLGSYRRIVFHNDRPGNKKISWPYYKDFEDLYGWKKSGIQNGNGFTECGFKVSSSENFLPNGITQTETEDEVNGIITNCISKQTISKRKKKSRQPTWFLAWTKRWEEQQALLLKETCRMHKEKMDMMMKLIEAIKEKK